MARRQALYVEGILDKLGKNERSFVKGRSIETHAHVSFGLADGLSSRSRLLAIGLETATKETDLTTGVGRNLDGSVLDVVIDGLGAVGSGGRTLVSQINKETTQSAKKKRYI